ncbi:HTH domain-containing protein [Thermoplasmatales archaeon SCGC AB-540-F20]|nr:HTH domain-containing protein [Thermoplasmatales archaeon SCGC AB-540-F20]
MIEIVNGTLEEQIIKLLQKIYPITISDIKKKLHVSRKMILRVLQKFQVKGIVQLEPLSNKTYIRLLRNDFSFVGKKRQRKFIKHHSGKKKQEPEDYDGIMYS